MKNSAFLCHLMKSFEGQTIRRSANIKTLPAEKLEDTKYVEKYLFVKKYVFKLSGRFLSFLSFPWRIFQTELFHRVDFLNSPGRTNEGLKTLWASLLVYASRKSKKSVAFGKATINGSWINGSWILKSDY